MKRTALAALLLVLLAAPAAAQAEPLWAGSPTDAVRRHIQAIIAVAVDPALTPETRRAAARSAIAQSFDFAELTRRALAAHWSRLTAQQRSDAIDALRARLTGAYATGIGRLLGVRMEDLRGRLRFVGESIAGDVAQVRMRVAYGGRDMPLAVSVMRHGRGWRIWDLDLDGVQLVDNIRAQIGHLSRLEGYGAALGRLRAEAAGG
ncbi:MAG TPA: ABC transporter substrate-binding protein [Methylomirabilota bacterium]|nr:ABC transporter substrate-binding protein [Methylomirabilota bacterium]